MAWMNKALILAIVAVSVSSCSRLSFKKKNREQSPLQKESEDICLGAKFVDPTDGQTVFIGTARCDYQIKGTEGDPPPPAPPPKDVYNKCPALDAVSFIKSRNDSLPIRSLFLSKPDNDLLRDYSLGNGIFGQSCWGFNLPSYFGVTHSSVSELLTTPEDLMSRFCVHDVPVDVTGVRAADVETQLTDGSSPILAKRVKRLAFSSSTGDATQAAKACHELGVLGYAGSKKWSMIGAVRPITPLTVTQGYWNRPQSQVVSYNDAAPQTLSTMSYLNQIGFAAPQDADPLLSLKFSFYGGGRLGQTISGHCDNRYYWGQNKSALMTCGVLNLAPGTEVSCRETAFPMHLESQRERQMKLNGDGTYTMGYAEQLGVICADFE
jgi:hypothetical protein